MKRGIYGICGKQRQISLYILAIISRHLLSEQNLWILWSIMTNSLDLALDAQADLDLHCLHMQRDYFFMT